MPSISSLLSFSVLLTFVLKVAVKRISKRWHLRNVPGPSSASVVAGDIPRLFDPEGLHSFHHMLNTHGRVIKLSGLFGETLLLVSDPKALSHVLIKDKEFYEEIDASGTLDVQRYLFGPGLLASIGAHHRKQRKLLNPAFSIAQLRRFLPLIRTNTMRLKNVLATRLSKGGQDINLADFVSPLALEVICQAGFGHTFNALENSSHGYLRAIKELVPTLSKLGAWIPLVISAGIPKLPAKVLHLAGRAIPYPDLQHLMDVVETMDDTTRSIWEDKKRHFKLQHNDVLPQELGNKDILTMLMNANALASTQDRLGEDELRSQVNTLIFGATDTTSSILLRIFHLLAMHPHVQERLRDELRDTGDLEYEALSSLPYLDAICRETLRLYAPFPLRHRRVTKDIVMPLHRPVTGVNGEGMHEIVVPKGTEVIVNIIGINTDPTIWGDDALEWKPERWLSPLPQTVPEARIPGVYSNSLTFLGGVRACIGVKFAELELKAILASLVPSLHVAPSDKEISWRFGPLITPTVKGDTSPYPQLPLRVSLVRDEFDHTL